MYTVFIGCHRFGEVASSRRCLKGSLKRMRFCTSVLLWNQLTTALELHSDVKKSLLEMKKMKKREEEVANREEMEYWAIL